MLAQLYGRPGFLEYDGLAVSAGGAGRRPLAATGGTVRRLQRRAGRGCRDGFARSAAAAAPTGGARGVVAMWEIGGGV